MDDPALFKSRKTQIKLYEIFNKNPTIGNISTFNKFNRRIQTIM